MPPKGRPENSPRKPQREGSFVVVPDDPAIPHTSDEEPEDGGVDREKSYFQTPERGPPLDEAKDLRGKMAADLRQKGLKTLGTVHSRLDLDGDGKVSGDELRQTASKGADMIKKQVDRYVTSKQFCVLVHETYVEMDMDGDETLNKVEVYCAVLKLYTKIIKFCPNAKPPTKLEVDAIVERMDDNGNNSICEAEFTDLARHVCEHVAARVIIQKVVSLLGAPVVATVFARLLDFFTPNLLTFWIPFKGRLKSVRNSLMVAVVISFLMPRMLDAGWKLVDRNSERRERFQELQATGP